jgi:sugar phosphate isomerase/epimerase
MELSRRTFAPSLAGCLCGASAIVAGEPAVKHAEVKGLIGLTSGSLTRHLSVTPASGKLVMLDLPRIMRDELDLRVLDLMTATLPSMQRDYLEKLRRRAEDAGVIITNLKMNQKNIDMGSQDHAVRRQAVTVYQRSIDAAEQLGCRWVRPLPSVQQPNIKAYVQSYRELIDYAEEKGITLLIENFGWLQDDPTAIPRIIKTVGQGLSASVDTGNWTDRARYDGLANAYPLAVTCDFKAFELGENDEHRRYDLQRCFQIGWDAGFRGPWCFEHFNKSLDGLLQGMIRLRQMIQRWVAA